MGFLEAKRQRQVRGYEKRCCPYLREIGGVPQSSEEALTRCSPAVSRTIVMQRARLEWARDAGLPTVEASSIARIPKVSSTSIADQPTGRRVTDVMICESIRSLFKNLPHLSETPFVRLHRSRADRAKRSFLREHSECHRTESKNLQAYLARLSP
jgi:hypothetical protein